MYTKLPAGVRLQSVFGLPEMKDKELSGHTIECEGFHKSKVFYISESGSSYFELVKTNPQDNEKRNQFFKVKVLHVEGYIFHEIS